MRVTLELGLLVGAGLLKTDLRSLDKSLIKLNTSLVYRQQKYNLLREETEGYSKLLVVLGAFPAFPEDASRQVGQVISIMGQFDLDPNRALDVVLDAFEQQTWNLAFLALLKRFHRESVVHIVGFKLAHYGRAPEASAGGKDADKAKTAYPNPNPNLTLTHKAKTASAAAPSSSSASSSAAKAPAATSSAASRTPSSLCTLVATLIAHGFFSLEQVRCDGRDLRLSLPCIFMLGRAILCIPLRFSDRPPLLPPPVALRRCCHTSAPPWMRLPSRPAWTTSSAAPRPGHLVSSTWPRRP